ncbi:MAG: 50S ribosomal protein L22 [Acidimicrobiia bacterium]|nr:50S ribosomal protein L22 [Acidimicrobiia bacterium]
MPGLKTNERPGTRASVKYVRSSAYKAREVLDLIRGKDYGEAREILAFSERGIAETVAKCLDSAVANAENNDGVPGDEVYVSACYADEGPTLKRWRPRARGRATRIRKRTCHITIIVTRYSADELQAIRDREALRGRTGTTASAADARRQRVAKSKERAAARDADHDHDHDQGDEEVEDAPVTAADVIAATDEALSDSDEPAEGAPADAEASAEGGDEPAEGAPADAEASAEGGDEPAEGGDEPAEAGDESAEGGDEPAEAGDEPAEGGDDMENE